MSSWRIRDGQSRSEVRAAVAAMRTIKQAATASHIYIAEERFVIASPWVAASWPLQAIPDMLEPTTPIPPSRVLGRFPMGWLESHILRSREPSWTMGFGGDDTMTISVTGPYVYTVRKKIKLEVSKAARAIVNLVAQPAEGESLGGDVPWQIARFFPQVNIDERVYGTRRVINTAWDWRVEYAHGLVIIFNKGASKDGKD